MTNHGMMMINIARLRERSAQCRERARLARSEDIAGELIKLAHDYDKDAARLELFGPERMYAFLQ